MSELIEISYTDFPQICRFCLENENLNCMFKDDGSPMDIFLIKMISSCLGIKEFLENDGLPQNICSSCIKTILAFSAYRSRCMVSLNHLQDILKETNMNELVIDKEHIDSKFEDNDECKSVLMELKIEQVGDYVSSVKFDYSPELSEDSKESFQLVDVNNRSLIHDQADSIGKKGAKSERSPPQLSHHNVDKKELCADCGTFYSHLKSHMETHRDKNCRKRYECDHCDAKFVNRASFIGHVNKHNNLQPYKCTKCDKAFHGMGNLRMHMNSHSTYNRYECSACDKKFKYSHMLALHRRNHTLAKVYQCEYCIYSNVNLENFKNHMMNHTGNYRFQCDICSKGFKKKSIYEKHLLLHQR